MNVFDANEMNKELNRITRDYNTRQEFHSSQQNRQPNVQQNVQRKNINGGQKRVKTIKESYASKASRSTRPSRRVLSEGSQVANRFEKLAGLI